LRSTKERSVKKILATIAACALLAACTKSGEVAQTSGGGAGARNAYTIPHTLRIGDTQDFDNLNPQLSTTLIGGNLFQLTMAYLVRYDAHNDPTPELATEVPTEANGGIGKDGLTITWHLRRGVKWSDGVPFDADDVVFSTNAVNNPANNEVGRDGWDLITKIDEPDKYTVVFHLRRKYSGYLPTFFGSAGANPCVLPKHILGNLPNINTAPYNSKPVGIGPFRFVEWVRGDHVTLEANPYYWRGQPKIKKIVYKIIPDRNTLLTQLQTGEVDMWTFIPAAFVARATALPNVKYARGPSYLYTHVDFNTSHPALKDKVVRQALRLATDRKTLLEKVSHGVGILQEAAITPASALHVDLPEIPYDVAAANKLLDDAGWKRGADGVRAKKGVRLDLEVATVSGNQDVDARIEQLRGMWQQIGVKITAKHYNSGLFFQVSGGILYPGKWDVTTFGWQMTPDADLNPENSCALIPPSGQNVTRLCDPALEKYLQLQKVTYSVEARKPIVTAAEKIIDADVPYEVLYVNEDVHAYNADLTNWHPNSSTPFDDFMNVDI
jgi:peptide/nickel transport system substrate-binding protein